MRLRTKILYLDISFEGRSTIANIHGHTVSERPPTWVRLFHNTNTSGRPMRCEKAGLGLLFYMVMAEDIKTP